MQVPTVRNFVLKHGSLRGFFDHHQADIVCFQVSKHLSCYLQAALLVARAALCPWTIRELAECCSIMRSVQKVRVQADGQANSCTLSPACLGAPAHSKAALQETKVLAEKLTKELACVDGFESFWAVSREKKGYSGEPGHPSTSCTAEKVLQRHSRPAKRGLQLCKV